MKTGKMVLYVKYDETVTDEESLASALDTLIETAMSTPGILDEYGTLEVGLVYPEEAKPVTQSELVSKTIGNAVELLYDLDVNLSNSLTGKPEAKRDQAIKTIREQLDKALDALHSITWIDCIKELEN